MARTLALITTVLREILAVAEPLLKRIATVGLIQSAVVLAAQTFMALFPLLIGVIALAPNNVSDNIVKTMRLRLGLVGDTSDQVQHLISTQSDVGNSITIFGLILVLASATSFTRALQRVYENAWQLPRLGLKGSIRGLEWLVGIVIYLTLLGFALNATQSKAVGVSALRLILVLISSFGWWWITPFLLLCGRVKLRAVLLTGALTSIAILIDGVVSAIYVPRIIRKNEAHYGAIGAVFAIQSWLVVVGALIVGAAILGALAAQSSGWIGTWTRGSADPDAWQRTKPESRILAKVRSKTGIPGASRGDGDGLPEPSQDGEHDGDH